MASTTTGRLSAVRKIQDLPDLFGALGYEPQFLPFDDGHFIVARWHGFRVAAVLSDTPSSTARGLARLIATRGLRGMACALGHDTLCLAAPHIGSLSTTKAYRIPLLGANAEQLDLLEAIRPDRQANALNHALRISELLSTEAAGDRFFRALGTILGTMANELDPKIPVDDRRNVALLSVTRILFLYFVQAKGWLNGERRFLRRHLDEALAGGHAFHAQVLDPLFFDTLNRPHSERRQSRFAGVPYLNGGLFQLHRLERMTSGRHLSNDLWRRAFDEIFEKFRFCVREADEVDAIAPDMLGRVFERLMATDQRRTSGTYYTPESLVQQIVETAIDTALGPRRANSWQGRLHAVRILDPACGSGAFLLGALEHLAKIHTGNWNGRPLSGCLLRRNILERNLFGVDLDPTAVRLAELRLWLALIADDAESMVQNVSPLPNLDGVVQQGDALLDPLAATRALSVPTSFASKAECESAERTRRTLFQARGSEYRRLIRELRVQEIELTKELIGRSTAALDLRLEELAELENRKDLFGQRVGPNAAVQAKRKVLQGTLSTLDRWRSALGDGAVPFFSFEVRVPKTMRRGGFDVVVGNPPWVRAERLVPEARRALRSRFTWWKGSSSHGYAHLPDLALAFLQRGLELTRPGGVLAFLVPSKLATAGYAESARHALVRETTIKYLHRVPQSESKRFEATTYPLAIVLQRDRPTPDNRLALDLKSSKTVSQHSMRGHGPWILLPDHERRALHTFLESAEPMSSFTRASLGLKTGADHVFVGTPMQRRGRLWQVSFGSEESWIEGEVIRPAVRGRDVSAFDVRTPKVVIWAGDASGNPKEAMPELALAYIAAHAPVLRARADYRGGPLWSVFRTKVARVTHRVVWPDIAQRPRVVYLEAGQNHTALPLNSCYCAPAASANEAHVMTAVLNSTWTIPYVRSVADEARGDYRRLNARVMNRVPIPRGQARCQTVIEISRDAHQKGHANQDDLDEVVAEALELTPATRNKLRAMARTACR